MIFRDAGCHVIHHSIIHVIMVFGGDTCTIYYTSFFSEMESNGVPLGACF